MQRGSRYALAGIFALLHFTCVFAAKFNVAGPPGSVEFGYYVLALSNGNFVVADPAASNGAIANAGAVSLFDHTGQLISVLRGRQSGDLVGSDELVAVGNSNVLVLSGNWKDDAGQTDGAVTWIDGTLGLSGSVTSDNSLTGIRRAYGQVSVEVVLLTNGNYVIANPTYNGGLGAATWGDGAGGTVGHISSANSLVGSSTHFVAWHGLILPIANTGVLALANGNYIVTSSDAVTWGNGDSGVAGEVSESNSLIGESNVYAYPLANGNYVAAWPDWHQVGAVAWGNGSTGTVGSVSADNALTGPPGVTLGMGATALSNGNYVVQSNWLSNRGAVTWGNGATGIVGQVSALNSLVGTHDNDEIGANVTPLCNGKYVVGSLNWNTGAGSATLLDGAGPTSAEVSPNNSLIGATSGTGVGIQIFALPNCNYVVLSEWPDYRGAATWVNGSSGLVGNVSIKNSLLGASANDYLGGIVALSNGNYLVESNNGTLGAVTWVDGMKGMTGVVSNALSLVGTDPEDYLGYKFALPNGNYLVASDHWGGETGSITWGNGFTGTHGTVSSDNSVIGAALGDRLASYDIFVYADGTFAVVSPEWNGGRGAVTLLNGLYRQSGVVPESTTVEATKLPTPELGGMLYSYSTRYHQLVVGRPVENVVTIVTMDEILRNGFDD